MAFYFRYVERLKIPPSSSIALGSSFHNAVEFGLERKLIKNRFPKVEIIKEVFSDSFDKLKKDVEWKKDEKPGKLKDLGIITTEKYYEHKAKKLKPKVIETELKIDMKNEEEGREYEVILIPDLITNDEAIVDFKLKRRSPGKKIGLDTYLQLLLYSLGYMKEYKTKPKILRTDYVICKTVPEYLSYKTKPEVEGFNNLLLTVDNVAKAIENEIFYVNPNCQFCSPDYCGYWNLCMGKKKI